ncbi:LysR family transcriptional regulator [Pseudonocardia kunmingensis]|uniref:LysR family transcriptional regulator n=1 Tax=Pseudonocardia kunmingensis TaxID=630975 RepID=UPI001153124B|nr:LysR family transcriptional regulator [Pseudonocardia kunmingensis]
MRYFLAVAQAGSIAEASSELHVAASAISRQIARLEHEIGVPLFERHPRGMVLSDAGVRLAAFVRRNVADLEQVVGEIRRSGGGHRTRIRVASAEGFAWDLLPEAIASFHRAHAGVAFGLHVTSSAAATEAVRDATADLAVTFSLTPARDVRVEYSQREYMHAIVNATHPVASRPAVSLAELRPYALAIVDDSTTVRQLFDICCSAGGLTFDPVLETDYSGALYTFAKLADAVTLAGRLPARRRLAAEGLVAVPVSDREMHRRYLQIQSTAGRTLPPVVQEFVAHLVERVRSP